MANQFSRRSFLGALATAAGGGLAGCQAPNDGALLGKTGEVTLRTQTEQERSGPPRDRTDGQRYRHVYEQVVDSVATVRTYNGRRGGQGSAFLATDDYLVTNQHVVAGANQIHIRYPDSGWIETSATAVDVYSDLAVLEAQDAPESATPLSFVQREPGIGTEVVAVGNPFGLSGSMSAGIVSGVDRTLPAANGFSIPDAIQTDAAVNPGNSGGPLVNLQGGVVGVINSGGGDNIGFGISAALTRRVVPSLVEDGEFDHSYMGVELTDLTPPIIAANDLAVDEGIYIDTVVQNGPSDGVLQGTDRTVTTAGVESPVGGDVVVQLNDTPTPSRQHLASFLALETSPGERITVDLIRDGTREQVQLELGERPPASS